MIIAPSCNERDRASVVGGIRIGVYARMQLRRSAQKQRPEKGRGDDPGDKSPQRVM